MKFFSKAGTELKKSAKSFFTDYLWFFILICLLVKTWLFMGMMYSADQRSIDLFSTLSVTPFSPIYLAFILVPMSFVFLFKKKGKIIFILALDFAISFLMLIDMWNFRAFGKFPTMHSLSQLGLLDNLGTTVMSLLNIIDLIFVADIIIAIIMILIFNKKLSIVANAKRNIIAFVLVLIFAISSIAFLHYMIDKRHSSRFPTKYMFFTCWTPPQTMKDLSPIGYHIYDIYVFWQDCQPVVLTDKDKADIKSWYQKKNENLPDNKYKGLFKGKNLIFIETESLENFVVNRKINGQEITPVLNKLIKNGIYFNNFHEQVFNGTSSDAMLLSNTSVFPIRKGVTFYRFPYNTYNSMPVLMESLGYKSIACEPDRGSYWNWETALTSFGFDKCLDSADYKMDDVVGMGLSDASFLRQVGDVVLKQKSPFYMFMVTQTTHTPYSLPYKLRELELPSTINSTKMGGYLQSLHYTDKNIGLFLDKLDKAGILDNTVVVLYGDHEGMHKFYPSEVNLAKPVQDWWNDNGGEVPFVIYSKGYKGEVKETIGGEIDILPTVSYLMGVPEKQYSDTAMGRNLFKTNRNYAAINRWKYVGDKEYKNFALKGIDIADKIISSNYFKK